MMLQFKYLSYEFLVYFQLQPPTNQASLKKRDEITEDNTNQIILNMCSDQLMLNITNLLALLTLVT